MADLDRVVELWAALAAEQRRYGSHVVPGENREAIRMLAGQRVVDGELLLAREGDEVVGFLMFDVEREGYEGTADRGFVQYVFVEPEWRRRGVGTALFDEAEAVMRDRGAAAVALAVMAGNEDARRFYRRRGYAPFRVTYERPLDGDSDADAE